MSAKPGAPQARATLALVGSEVEEELDDRWWLGLRGRDRDHACHLRVPCLRCARDDASTPAHPGRPTWPAGLEPDVSAGAEVPVTGPEQAPVVLLWPPGAFVVTSAATVVPMVRSGGRWIVRTQSSAYLVDLDGAVTTRFPRESSASGHVVAELRRDGDDVELVSVAAVVGASMQLVLALRGDGILTHRQTTAVVSIEPAPSIPDTPGRGSDRSGGGS